MKCTKCGNDFAAYWLKDGMCNGCKNPHLIVQCMPVKTHFYSSGSGRIELEMTMDQARSASHQGQCDDDVLDLSNDPGISAQLEKIDPKLLASELAEFGAWDKTELSDHAENLQRLLWIAAGDIVEQDE